MKKTLLIVLVALIVIAGATVGIIAASVSSLTTNTEIKQDASTQFFDVNGELIGTSESEENRLPISVNRVPKQLEQAFLAAEDIRFYEHGGVDIRGIFRAVLSNITSKGISEGGSTITQQLAKNAFLTQERTIKRKLQEIVIAIKLESKYSKKEILEMYLNQIYFGRGVYGVEAASMMYFGKSVDQIDLAEAAMLAGIPKSPNYYSPLNNLEASKERQGIVLSQMLKYGFINKQQFETAKNTKIVLKSSEAISSSKRAAYFLDYVSQLIVDEYGADALYKGGLKVYTSLDIKQQIAAESVVSMMPTVFKTKNGIEEPQLALVAVEPSTGYIRAMLGGRGGKDQYNRAVLSTRQPGSAMKPFVYLAAVEAGMDAATIIEDKPVKFGTWEPNNYDRTFSGWVSMRNAVARSLNIPSVLVAQKVTPEKIIHYARQLGISTLVSSGPVSDVNLAATALGGLTKGIIPLEMAGAMATLANGGVYNKPVAIVKIVDRSGKTLFTHKAAPQNVVSAKSAYILTDLLQTVVQRGTGTGAAIGRPAAGKTGTTDTYVDAWFVGYTPDLAAAVWIGNDEGGASLPGNMTGGALPATIWSNFMSKALAQVPAKGFAKPAGVNIPIEPAIPADGGDPNALRIPAPPGTSKQVSNKDKKDDKDSKDKDNKATTNKSDKSAVTNSPPPAPPVPQTAPPVPPEPERSSTSRPSAPVIKS